VSDPIPRSLRLLLVQDTPNRGTVAEAVAGLAGVAVTQVLDSPLELLRSVELHQPDVVLIDTASPTRDVLVVLTDDAHEAAIHAALGAGVSAYVVDGVEPRRLEPILRIAIERFRRQQEMRAELEDTRARLAERKQVEQAKGILMKQRGCDEQEAFAALRSLAMQRGIRLGEAARQVIDVASLLG
jgi:response regulator NasT